MVYLYELYEQSCWQGDDCPGEGEGKGEGEEGGFEEGEVEDDEEGDQLNLSGNQLDLNLNVSFEKGGQKAWSTFFGAHWKDDNRDEGAFQYLWVRTISQLAHCAIN